MYYNTYDTGLPTLEIGLDSINMDELKKLATLTGQKVFGKKADIIAIVVRQLAGDRLRAVWESLDELQRAAVAETVHSPSSQFDGVRFRAKYGRDPEWGFPGERRYDRMPSALCLLFYRNKVMPDDLKARLLAFVPKPRQVEIAALDRLPSVFARPFERWNEKTRVRETGTEDVPLAVFETERAAQRELLSILRLVDTGKVAVSDKTRRASASTVEAITAILDQG